jgi:hypothetical protein
MDQVYPHGSKLGIKPIGTSEEYDNKMLKFGGGRRKERKFRFSTLFVCLCAVLCAPSWLYKFNHKGVNSQSNNPTPAPPSKGREREGS